MVQKETLTAPTIATETLQNGLYYIQMFEGETIYLSEKVVIRH